MTAPLLVTDNDAYEWGGRIGVGQMAEVFSGKARSTGARVAIKRLLPALATSPEFVDMFVDEARIGRLLRHENLVAVLDVGMHGEDHCMVLERIDGVGAEALLANLPVSERDAIALHIVERVARALHHLHTLIDPTGQQAQIVHRDVCPNNVVVDVSGVPRLIDLGIAHAAPHLRVTQTQGGVLKGRFSYMSPEQVVGQRPAARDDLFALGAVLYEWLAGQRAFVDDSDFRVLEKVRAVDFVPLDNVRPDLPPVVRAFVARALARDRDDRFTSAQSFAAHLAAAIDAVGERSSAALAAAVSAAFPSVQRRDVVAAALDELEAVPPGATRR